MDIWITWCRKESKCRFCEEKIKTAEPITVGKLWMVHGDSKRWPIIMRWHPECWLKQGLLALEKRPYVPAGNRGRKQLVMSAGDKVMRNKILRRRASFFFRLRAAAEAGQIDKVIKIMSSMEKLAVEIAKYGGVPESWIIEEQ